MDSPLQDILRSGAGDFLGGFFATSIWFLILEYRHYEDEQDRLRTALGTLEESLEQIEADISALLSDEDLLRTWGTFSVESATAILRTFPKSQAHHSLIPHLSTLRTELGEANAWRTLYYANTTGASVALNGMEHEIESSKRSLISKLRGSLQTCISLRKRIPHFTPKERRHWLGYLTYGLLVALAVLLVIAVVRLGS